MFSTLFDNVMSSFSSLQAEEQASTQQVQNTDTSARKDDNSDVGEEEAEAAEPPAEEEEEDEEEPEDEAPAIREKCEEEKCHSFRHHYEECAARVASGKTLIENENCVEELFHLMHCVDDCAAAKVFATLK